MESPSYAWISWFGGDDLKVRIRGSEGDYYGDLVIELRLKKGEMEGIKQEVLEELLEILPGK